MTDLLIHFALDCAGGCTASWLRCKCPHHRLMRSGLFIIIGLATSEVTIRLVG